jgi:hypothetical protein
MKKVLLTESELKDFILSLIAKILGIDVEMLKNKKINTDKIEDKLDKVIKSKETEKETEKEISQNKKTENEKITKPTIKSNSYIIDIKNSKSKDFTLIWGGMPSTQYGAKFMRDQAKGYFENKNVIYSNYENSLETLKNVLKNNGIKNFRIKSVSGFSRGGINTWAQLNGSYDFIGLIDPSTPKAYSKLPSNTKMISRWENWGSVPSYQKNIKTMEQNKTSLRIPSKTYNHLEMPKIFYEKYSNLM